MDRHPVETKARELIARTAMLQTWRKDVPDKRVKMMKRLSDGKEKSSRLVTEDVEI